ncbi:MAG: hypothetical protein ACO3JL_03045 [Myxococcota bacterium]
MKTMPFSQIAEPAWRKLATAVDEAGGGGDGAVSIAELDRAIEKATADVLLGPDVSALRALRTFVLHCGEGPAAASPPGGDLGGGGYSPHALHAAHLSGQPTLPKPPLLLRAPLEEDSCTQLYQVPAGARDVEDRQSVLIPLDDRELHLIELKYQDTRPLRDLEFNYREPGALAWRTARGDEWFELLAKEKRGEVEIKRESDHGGPWINNPIRVKVDVLLPDGRVHEVGRKFLDFHVHDAHSPDSSGYPETDNISNGYERLPRGKLPAGSLLRLTPVHENRKPWEADRTVAAQLSWVKPIYRPDHQEQVCVHSAASWGKPAAGGYPVDPARTIAAVLVTWTDHGGMSSGSLRLPGPQGDWRSPRYNIGSGETELIPVGRRAENGLLHVEGDGMELNRIEVLYAE